MPSPNHGARRNVHAPDMVVVHYTAMTTAEAAASRLCDAEAEVSAHYLIAEDGRTWLLVPEERRAWHAGVASWGGVDDVNSHSIGIELANFGHHLGYPPFPEAQMAALERLLGDMLDRWAISPERVVGHACVAPGRKIDPGEKFDWRRLAQRGLAVWLPFDGGDERGGSAIAFQQAARRIGYPVPRTGSWDDETLAVWRSFAMRFLPQRAGTPPDAASVRHVERVASEWPVLDPAARTA